MTVFPPNFYTTVCPSASVDCTRSCSQPDFFAFLFQVGFCEALESACYKRQIDYKHYLSSNYQFCHFNKEAIKLTMVWQTSSFLTDPNFNLGCTRLEEQINTLKANCSFQPPITYYIFHSSSLDAQTGILCCVLGPRKEISPNVNFNKLLKSLN